MTKILIGLAVMLMLVGCGGGSNASMPSADSPSTLAEFDSGKYDTQCLDRLLGQSKMDEILFKGQVPTASELIQMSACLSKEEADSGRRTDRN